MKKILKAFNEKRLLFVVFATGACVLILEIVALRILSPYFGNTIFSASSVIGVVLMALSLGYYFGGRYADKNPKSEIFFFIILLSGISTIFIQIFNIFLLPLIAYELSYITGPVLVSLIIFLIPSFLLGILSPFVIKLQEVRFPKQGIGKLSGEVFFFSTFGSIFGTFLAGFYLIPNFGIDRIVIGVGLILIFIGIFGSMPLIKKNRGLSMFILFFSLFGIITSINKIENPSVIYSKDGIYEKITIVDLPFNDTSARVLMQDASFSSAINLDNPEDLVFEYTNYYKLYKLFNENPKKALFIGGGAYTMPRSLIEEAPEIVIDVVDIEPDLYSLAKKYFKLKESPRLKSHLDDGRRFLQRSDGQYDIIFSDVYSSIYSIPSHFTTIEFFNLAKQKLSKDGIFLANIISDISRQKPSLLLSEINTFKKVFKESYFIAVEAASKSDSQNIIFLGVKSDSDINLTQLISESEDEYIRNLDSKLIDLRRFNVSNYPVLRDNYSPTDIMSASLIIRNSENKTIFQGKEAISLISQQLSYGERYSGSDGNKKTRDMIATEMEAFNADVKNQTWEQDHDDKKVAYSNVLASFNPENQRRIILGTHFDSRRFSDLDKIKPRGFMPGANDSASGVAVLMELARTLENRIDKPDVGIDFMFFDGEEGYEDEKWYPIGSTYFAERLADFYTDKKPEIAVIVDMVCDKNLDIYYERNSLSSASKQMSEFIDLAKSTYPKSFHKELKYTIYDDHIPLIKAGIPSFLLIDFNYPYFHTTKDTLDKCSGSSLEAVGNSLMNYIYSLN